MSRTYVVILHLDVRDGTRPHKWDWDNLIDTSATEVIVDGVTVYDTENLPERVRLTETGVEEM